MAKNYCELEKRDIKLEIEEALLRKQNWRVTCKDLDIGKDYYFRQAKVIYEEHFPKYLLSKEQIVIDFLDSKQGLIDELRQLKASPERIALENKIRQETFDSLIKIGVLPSTPQVTLANIKVVFDSGEASDDGRRNSEDKV